MSVIHWLDKAVLPQFSWSIPLGSLGSMWASTACASLAVLISWETWDPPLGLGFHQQG